MSTIYNFDWAGINDPPWLIDQWSNWTEPKSKTKKNMNKKMNHHDDDDQFFFTCSI